MSKNNNNKEKSSFWKKLGLGKNKTTTTASSLRSEQDNHDKSSVKSKRLSGMFLQQPTQQNDPLPPLPTKTIKKQPRVNLPKVMDDDNILSNFHQQHVDLSSQHHQVDISGESIVTPTADILHQESTTIDTKNNNRAEQKDSTIVYSTEQPNVTPAITKNSSSDDDEVDNNSNSSFVVVKSNDNIQQLSPVIHSTTTTTTTTTTTNNDELLAIISNLKIELENEKATVNVLQKQKEAVAKDLDYLELTVDELFSEKTDLLQQLEDEKIKSQQYLDDLNLSLEKQKSTADNARDQSFAVDQTKLEFEAYQEQCRQEQQELLSDIATKDKTIRELKSKLSKSQEQVEILKTTMDQLIKSHAEEMSRTAAQATADKEKSQLPLHTPNGSPRIKPAEEEDWNHHQTSSPIIPVPSSSTPFFNNNNNNTNNNQYDHYGTPQSMTRMDSSDHQRTQKESVEYMDEIDLDDQLVKLLKEKEKLQSYYSKIPLTGGGPQSRRRKEELEAMLDQVDSQLSKVKQKIRRS